MKIVQPSFKVLYTVSNEIALPLLEQCARTAYKSEDKICEGSAEVLIKGLLNKEPAPHESVIEHLGFTVSFICDRGISHELVRHRLCSFTQESTRYCNYSKDKFGNEITVIQPPIQGNDLLLWVDVIKGIEETYMEMINNGVSPQLARSILPNCLKTEIAMTANFRQWRHIFKLRTDKTAHPQMREIMIPLQEWAKNEYPIIFGYPKFPFGKIPSKFRCKKCNEFDLDGCPNCPGFEEY